MIFIIEDDPIMAECLVRACTGHAVRSFPDAISAMANLDTDFPSLIFLDLMLTGPNGFTFLNELASYTDTAKIPVVIVSGLDLAQQDLSAYGVVGQLNKDNFTPQELRHYVEQYSRQA